MQKPADALVKAKRGDQRKQLGLKRDMIQELQKINQGDFNETIKGLQAYVDVILEDEELKWRQRAKEKWLKKGDINSKFFHKCASHIRQDNTIKKISNERGCCATIQEGIYKLFQEFYQDLFSSSHPSGIEEILRDFDPIVSNEMNRQLEKECTVEEVEKTLFETNPLRSPRPDGISARFYQDNWSVVGQGVISAVKGVFAASSCLESVNETFIVLISQKVKLDFVYEFRPISLCNMVYKIVSKVLSNGLKTILSHISFLMLKVPLTLVI